MDCNATHSRATTRQDEGVLLVCQAPTSIKDCTQLLCWSFGLLLVPSSFRRHVHKGGVHVSLLKFTFSPQVICTMHLGGPMVFFLFLTSVYCRNNTKHDIEPHEPDEPQRRQASEPGRHAPCVLLSATKLQCYHGVQCSCHHYLSIAFTQSRKSSHGTSKWQHIR